jgi:hypothetical protein
LRRCGRPSPSEFMARMAKPLMVTPGPRVNPRGQASLAFPSMQFE